MTRTRVLVTCPTFEPGFRGGGPIKSVAQIVDSAPETLDVRVLTSDRDLRADAPYEHLSGRTLPRGRVRVTYLNKRNPLQWLQMIRSLRSEPIEILYLNSLWEPWFSLLPLLLAFAHIVPVRTVLIAPRGELSAGALSLKARKKKMVLPVLRWLTGRPQVVWHASTPLEAADIRRALRVDPRLIIVSPDVTSGHVNPAQVEMRPAPIRFVFVSRISPTKNLDLAIEALAAVTTDAIFDIFGPLEDSEYWSLCRAKIAALPARIKVTYRGELSPTDVSQAFAEYDAFIFPTLGENFGHVIAESLAACCPVICSDHTPWSPVLENGGGAVVRELTGRVLGDVLAGWAAKSPAELVEARAAAGAAFSTWFAEQSGTNVLDLVASARRSDS